jgi:predicted transcriptional regulator
MIPIQPVSTRLNDEQRVRLRELAQWLNWSESDVIRFSIQSVHQIVCQKSRNEIPAMIRMAREGRRNPICTGRKQGTAS